MVDDIERKYNELWPEDAVETEQNGWIRDSVCIVRCPVHTVAQTKLYWIFEELLSSATSSEIDTTYNNLYPHLTQTDTETAPTNLRVTRLLISLNSASVIITELITGNEWWWTKDPDQVLRNLTESKNDLRTFMQTQNDKIGYIARVARQSTPTVSELTKDMLNISKHRHTKTTELMNALATGAITESHFVTRGLLGGPSADRAQRLARAGGTNPQGMELVCVSRQ